ncbi:MAG: hypothetical protein Kow0098_22800 [Ignavibacteriaceae bacterium]
MELIPILSTIILVATISTFILAVGAYILYKIREKKTRVVSEPHPQSVTGELVTPVSEQQYADYPEGKELKIPGNYTTTKQTIRKPAVFTNAGSPQSKRGLYQMDNQSYKQSADYYRSELKDKQEKFTPFTPEESAFEKQKPKSTIKWR